MAWHTVLAAHWRGGVLCDRVGRQEKSRVVSFAVLWTVLSVKCLYCRNLPKIAQFPLRLF
jgi:hypothetical protein